MNTYFTLGLGKSHDFNSWIQNMKQRKFTLGVKPSPCNTSLVALVFRLFPWLPRALVSDAWTLACTDALHVFSTPFPKVHHLAGGVTPPRKTGKACISISESSAFCISFADEASGIEFIMRMQSLHWLTWLLGQPPAGKWGVKDFLMEKYCQVLC